MNKKSINSALKKSILLISTTILITFISIVIASEYYQFKNNYDYEKKLIEDEKKLFLKIAVKNVKSYLNYKEANSKKKIKEKLEIAVNNAFNQAKKIYENNKNTISTQDIKKIIITTLSEIRHFNGRGYIYIIDIDKNKQIHSFNIYPNEEILSNVSSCNLKNPILKEIENIKNKGDLFFNYKWLKPWDNDSTLYFKTSYNKYFKPFNWIIGCGEYTDDHFEETQQEILKYLNSSYSAKDWNLFINHYDGTSIIINSLKYKSGVNIKDISDNNGLKIFTKELKIAQSGNPDFLYYNWPINENKFMPKIAFIDGFDKWNWMIGASSSLQMFDSLELQLIKSFYQVSWLRILFILLLTIPFIIFILYQLRKTANTFKHEFNIFYKQIESGILGKLNKQNFQIIEFNNLSLKIDQLLTDHLSNINALRESEKKFRILVEHAPLNIMGINNQGLIQIWNKQCEKFFKISQKEILNQTIQIESIFDKTQVDQVKRNLYIDNPEFRLFPIKLKNGKYAYQHWASFRISENLLIWVGNDVTELKNTEKELIKNKNFLDILLESIPNPIFYKNTKDIYLGGNSAFFNLIGKNSKKVIGKEIYDLYPEYLAKIYHKKDLEVFEGKFQQYDFEFKNNTNEKKNFTCYKAPFRNQDNKIEGLIGIMLDITDRIQFENELKKKQTELKDLNTSKDRFFSIIAHDLINPFNVMLNSGEMLAESVNEKNWEDAKDMINLLNPAINNAYDLLLNLLEWARTQMGSIKFQPQKIKICSDLEISINLMNSMAKAKNINLIYKITESPEIYLDTNMFRTIIRNLISNAIKFTPEGGQIKVYTNYNNKYLQVCISDNGIGMDKITKDNLFNINKNISKKGTNDESGTGIGLLLVNDFVKKHNGKITINSEKGIGTNISIWFPVKK